MSRKSWWPAFLITFAFASGTTLAGAPVFWTLSGVTFTDGSTATGSFLFDASTDAVSDIDILLPDTSGIPPSTMLSVEATTMAVLIPNAFVFTPAVALTNGAEIPALVLIPTPLLTNAGGSVSLSGVNGFSAVGLICNSDCDSVVTDQQIDAGSLVGAAVPEPNSAALLAVSLGLGFLKLGARRKLGGLSRRDDA